MQGICILDPMDPKALFIVVLKYVGTKFEPAKMQDNKCSHQTIKYLQYAVGTSQVSSAALLLLGSGNI